MRRIYAATLLALPLAAFAAGSGSADATWNAKLGYDWEQGKYGALRDTTTETASATISYDSDAFGVDLLVPYLRERGPGRVLFLPGRRPVIVFGPDRRASGIGDVTAGLTGYVLNQERSGIDLDLGTIVKFGTASAAKGLGTGKMDDSVQAALGRSLGPVDATLTLGYTFVGKAPGLDLRNASYGSFDVNAHLNRAWSVGATYDWGQSPTRSESAGTDARLYLTFYPRRGVSIEAYVLKGWSNQSPDRGGGLTVGWDL